MCTSSSVRCIRCPLYCAGGSRVRACRNIPSRKTLVRRHQRTRYRIKPCSQHWSFRLQHVNWISNKVTSSGYDTHCRAVITRCRAKPGVNPSVCAAPLAACVHRTYLLDIFLNWLPWQRPLKNRKSNFRLIIFSRSSVLLQNLAKIGPVDFEIIGLTGKVKNK